MKSFDFAFSVILGVFQIKFRKSRLYPASNAVAIQYEIWQKYFDEFMLPNIKKLLNSQYS